MGVLPYKGAVAGCPLRPFEFKVIYAEGYLSLGNVCANILYPFLEVAVCQLFQPVEVNYMSAPQAEKFLRPAVGCFIGNKPVYLHKNLLCVGVGLCHLGGDAILLVGKPREGAGVFDYSEICGDGSRRDHQCQCCRQHAQAL